MTPYQIFSQKTQAVANTALLVTPIISRQAPPLVDALGSGLFLMIDDDYFLVSAGHLLNIKDWPNLLVPGKNGDMVWLNGTLATTFDTGILNSKIDFAVLKFSQRQVKHLINGYYGFIKTNHILINHKIKQGENYIIAGYPINGVKKQPGKSVYVPIPLKIVTSPIPLKRYKKYGFDPDLHILVKYQRRLKSFRSKGAYISMKGRGISGSGLWFVPNWNKIAHNVPQFFLAGIVIEDYNDRGFLAALRIDFIIETIRQVFNKPHLNASNINVGKTISTLFMAEIP